MKVLAFNCSPQMDSGNTALILDPFLEGMKEAGAEIEVLYTKKLDINPCKGEFHCWVTKPGECIQDDDMRTVLPKLADSEIWVFATPVYFDGAPGPMKNLLDRMLPLGDPFLELRDGHCRHPLRKGVKQGRIVLISNCGFWEMDNFDPLLVHMEAISRNLSRQFAGALLRPHGGALKPMKKRGMRVDDIFEASKEAGRQLVSDGEMSEETLRTVSRPILPLNLYVQSINKRFG